LIREEIKVNETTNISNLKYQIELLNITKRFEEVIAVDNVNINIGKGEFFSLLGPSGCGKTTTLRIIAGLENPTSGNIILDGKDVTNIPAHRRNVNTVFQDYAIFPHMSVYENIYFPLKMRKIPKKEANPKIEKVLKIVNMNDYKHRYSRYCQMLWMRNHTPSQNSLCSHLLFYLSINKLLIL